MARHIVLPVTYRRQFTMGSMGFVSDRVRFIQRQTSQAVVKGYRELGLAP